MATDTGVVVAGPGVAAEGLDAWRRGFSPVLSLNALAALLGALEGDDPRLVQNATTLPAPVPWGHAPLAPHAACAVGYCGWQGDGMETVAEVEQYFAAVCREADFLLGHGGACGAFLGWFDAGDRAAVFTLLAAEVRGELVRRLARDGGVPPGGAAP